MKSRLHGINLPGTEAGDISILLVDHSTAACDNFFHAVQQSCFLLIQSPAQVVEAGLHLRNERVNIWCAHGCTDAVYTVVRRVSASASRLRLRSPKVFREVSTATCQLHSDIVATAINQTSQYTLCRWHVFAFWCPLANAKPVKPL